MAAVRTWVIFKAKSCKLSIAVTRSGSCQAAVMFTETMNFKYEPRRIKNEQWRVEKCVILIYPALTLRENIE